MTIRHAMPEDVPALVALGRRMHALTRFRSYDYDEAKVARSLADLIHRGRHRYVALVAQDAAGCLVGVLIGVLEQHIFSDRVTASVMHYDVLPESRMGGHGLRLLRAFERWCAHRQVFEIALGVNSGVEIDRLARFLRRVGFTKVGENYVKSMAIPMDL